MKKRASPTFISVHSENLAELCEHQTVWAAVFLRVKYLSEKLNMIECNIKFYMDDLLQMQMISMNLLSVTLSKTLFQPFL